MDNDGAKPTSNEGEQSGDIQSTLQNPQAGNLQEIPEELEQHLLQLISIETQKHFSGPLPPPEMLAEYEGILPGLAKQIVDRADTEQAFRHEATRYSQQTERKALYHAATKTYLGQIGAFVISMTTLGGSFWVINSGHSAAGIAGIVTALTILAAVFIVGKRSASNEEPGPDDSNQKKLP